MHRIIPRIVTVLITGMLPLLVQAAATLPAMPDANQPTPPSITRITDTATAQTPSLSELFRRIFAPIRSSWQQPPDATTTPARVTPEEHLLSIILPKKASQPQATSSLHQIASEALGINEAQAPNCVSEPFTQTLRPGMQHEAVRRLQRFLNQNRKTRIAKTGPGSPGNETTYYGPATTAAVKRFQALFAKDILAPNNLQAPTGIWGPATIKQANKIVARCKALQQGKTP